MLALLIERLIAKYGVLKLAVAAFILLVVLMFAAAIGWNKIQTVWFKHKAERAEVRAVKAERVAEVAKADEKQTENAAKIAVITTNKQDVAVNKQRKATAKAVEVINERIIQEPVSVLPDVDDAIMLEVHAARYRAQAAADRVPGTQGN